MKIITPTVLALGAAGLLATSVHAAPVFYEGFDYTGGETLGDESSWAVVGGADGGTIDATGYTYGTLPVTGGHLDPTGGVGYTLAAAATAVDNAGLLDDGATLWMSAIVQPKVGANANLVVRLGDAYVSNNNAIAGGDSVGFNLQNGNDIQNRYNEDGGAVNPGSIVNNSPVDENVLIVIEMIWNANDALPDTLNYYLPDATLALGTIKKTINTIDFNQGSFDTVSIAGNNTNTASLDEIRFGATYNDVITAVPEPGSLALLGLGGLLIAGRRRRG